MSPRPARPASMIGDLKMKKKRRVLSPSKTRPAVSRERAAQGPAPKRPKVLIIDIPRHIHRGQRVFPLAGGLLKAYADARLSGKCVIKTLDLFEYSSARALDFVAAWKPDIVAFSCYVWNFGRVESLCRAIKQKYPRKAILLGGPEAMGGKELLLDKLGADAIVIGEGEAAFTELLSRSCSGRAWTGVPGTLVRSGGKVHEGPPTAFLDDLDTVPSQFNDAGAAARGFPRGGGIYTLETMRGCPKKCAFCVWTNLRAAQTRYFSDKRIVSDLNWAAKNAPDASYFVSDSDMFLDHDRALRLLPFFHTAAREGNCSFVFQTNLSHWDDKLMSACDCDNFDINIGVNSINPDVQKIMGRSCARSVVEKKLERMRALAPRACITLQTMFAVPGETFSGFCSGFDWAWRQPVTYTIFYHTQVFQGTPLRERAAELGIKFGHVPPYFITSTRECAAEEIMTEGLIIAFVALWMAEPRSRALFSGLAASRFGGSFSAAFLKLWENLDAPVRRLALETLRSVRGESKLYINDLQLFVRKGYEGPGMEISGFLKAAHAALFTAHDRLAAGRGRSRA